MNPAYYLKFKILDLRTGKILKEADGVHATITYNDDVASVIPDRPDLMPLLFTGENAMDGNEIFQDDVVEAMVDGEAIFDLVVWIDGAWRFGGYDGVLMDYIVNRVIGSRHDGVRWPEPDLGG